jgi:hypothetical protein
MRGDGGPGLSATLNSGGAQDLAGGPDGSLYWVESVKPGYSVPTVIRKRNPAGIVSRVVGNGQECVTFSSAPAGCGDGLPALDVPLSLPEVEVAPDGALWIADGDGTYNGTHSLLRRLDADGRIRTVYGTGQNSGPDGPDGPAGDTPLSVYGFVIGRDGSIFFHDKLRIHQITPDGTVRKVTGSYGTCTRSPATGECGIGGPAIDADLSGIPRRGRPLSVMRASTWTIEAMCT